MYLYNLSKAIFKSLFNNSFIHWLIFLVLFFTFLQVVGGHRWGIRAWDTVRGWVVIHGYNKPKGRGEKGFV